MTAKEDELPEPSRVVRYVPFARMRKDEDDMVTGPLPSAFVRREGESYLSVTWCEYFEGRRDEQLRCSVEAIRGSKLNVKSKACFCVAETAVVAGAIEQATARRGRALYHPEEDNMAHAGIYGVPTDDEQLLDLLAEEVWSAFLSKDQADALPVTLCAKSADVA